MTKPLVSGNARKKIELEIIRMLRENARAKKVDMASRLRVSSAGFAGLMESVSSRYVMKYSSLIDFESLGYFVSSFFIVRLPKEEKKKESLIGLISGMGCVNTAMITSRDELLVEALFRNMAGFVDFRHSVQEIAADVEEHEIISVVEKERFIP